MKAPQVLLVSRPYVPQRPDGTGELVRNLARTGGAPQWPVRYHLLAPWGERADGEAAVGEAAVGEAADREAAVGEAAVGEAAVGEAAVGEAAVGWGARTHASALPGGFGWRPFTMLQLLRAPLSVIRHYFFTPTPGVVTVLRNLQRLRPAPSVQTLSSTPDDHVALRPLVFAHHVVALSRHTRDRLLAEGLPTSAVHFIPPAVPLPPLPDTTLRARVRQRLHLPPETRLLLYLGDYDTAGTAECAAAALGPLLARPGLVAVFACRPKGARHREVEAVVRDILASAGAPPLAVRLVGRIPFARELAAAADLAVFPARRLPHKMDLPLALLQSLAAGVPSVVADTGPLADLVRAGAALGVPVGTPEPLRRAILHLLEDTEAHRALGEAARRHMANEGSVARMGQAHAELYRRLGGDAP